jgi:hypothetical protein
MSNGGGFSAQNRIKFAAGTEIFHEGQAAYATFWCLRDRSRYASARTTAT